MARQVAPRRAGASSARGTAPVFVALLRGINVGTAKRVAMTDLAAIVTSLGFRDVRTFLNSGNVVFRGAASRAQTAGPRIERALVRRLGVASAVTVRSAEEMAAVVDAMPFDLTGKNPSRLMVVFCRSTADEARVAPLVSRPWGREKIAAGPGVVYVWCPDSMLESPLYAEVAKAGGDAITTRNWSTTAKLARMASGATP